MGTNMGAGSFPAVVGRAPAAVTGLALLLLAGCGGNVVDRTISGGLIGAGGGPVMGAAR